MQYVGDVKGYMEQLGIYDSQTVKVNASKWAYKCTQFIDTPSELQ